MFLITNFDNKQGCGEDNKDTGTNDNPIIHTFNANELMIYNGFTEFSGISSWHNEGNNDNIREISKIGFEFRIFPSIYQAITRQGWSYMYNLEWDDVSSVGFTVDFDRENSILCGVSSAFMEDFDDDRTWRFRSCAPSEWARTTSLTTSSGWIFLHNSDQFTKYLILKV